VSEHRIVYRFSFQDGRDYSHEVVLDPVSQVDISPVPESSPPWTELAFKRCRHCPLDAESHDHCPFAQRLAPLLEAFAPTRSYDLLTLVVEDGRRHLRQSATVQQAVGSLLGLVCATSGCPYGVPFRPLARFHLPLASPEETLFRVVGAHLLRHFLVSGRADETDMTELYEVYRDIHAVNLGMAARLRAAADTDAAVNAIVLLDMLAGYVPDSLEDMLGELRTVFGVEPAGETIPPVEKAPPGMA